MGKFKPAFAGDTPFAASIRAGCDAQGIQHGGSTPYDPNQYTLDTAQEWFRAYPSMRSAGIYMDMLILYEQDDMIEDDTWLDGLAELRDYLLGVRHDKP